MQERIDSISNRLNPFIEKMNANVWLQSLQQSIQNVLPFIFVGSLTIILSKLSLVIPGFPNFEVISNFSFGLLGLLLAYLFPSNLLQHKKILRFHTYAGFTTMALYLLMSGIVFKTNGMATINYGALGAGGMFVSIFLGIFVSNVMIFFSKHSFFKNNDSLPDIIVTWFDAILPIFICFLVGWTLAYPLHFKIFDILQMVLSPLITGSNTYLGFMLLWLPPILLCSLGISGWALSPIITPILLSNTAANAAAGPHAIQVATFELFLCSYIAIGGSGNTFALNLLMLQSKSRQIKALGKAAIIPSIFNINEPITFGLIALNPIMMLGYILVGGIICPTIMYVALKIGWVPISHQVFAMQFLPVPIETFIVANNSFIGPIFALIMTIIAYFLFMPFFKIHEATVLKNEQAELDALEDQIEH